MDYARDGGIKRFPTPSQLNITTNTSETYWNSANSAWGIALAKLGHSVEQLPPIKSITFGNLSNEQDLNNYDLFIVAEPNIRYTSSEKTAILNFVNNGGGLFMISDHTRSVRNNDGYDSPAIWNDLMSNNNVSSNPFGVSFRFK